MVKRRFQSSVTIAKTTSFPGTDVGSNHELVIMTFRLRLQRVQNQGSIRIRFSLEKLKDPSIPEFFRATIRETFAPLLALENQDTKKDALINNFNTATTETAKNMIGKHWAAKKAWVTESILKLSVKRRELKQKKNTTEGAILYREVNQQIKKGMRKAMETDWRTMLRYRRKPAEKTTARKPTSS